MDLRTGSVVVPATGETMATLCPVRALTRLDLPALRRPKKAMCTRSADGVALRSAMGKPPLMMGARYPCRAPVFSF